MLGLAALGAAAAAGLRPALAAGPQYGLASWYGAWHHGRKMANGRPFDMWAENAAHRTLPFGTRCRVRNLRNGAIAFVTIMDRGPYIAPRILDVSRGTARLLGFEGSGVCPVELVPL
jgi:rare lipoprotein A